MNYEPWSTSKYVIYGIPAVPQKKYHRSFMEQKKVAIGTTNKLGITVVDERHPLTVHYYFC